MNDRSWAEFYRDRVNNKGYEEYFTKKYAEYLSSVACLGPYPTKIELGCGTALTTKLSGFQGVIGIDSNVTMLKYAKINAPTIVPIKMDLLTFKPVHHMAVYSHGVLEHFTDMQIRALIAKCKRANCRMVHYVPTDKYEHPSFGDERLLSVAHWLKLTRPAGHIVSKDGKDLTLLF